MFVGFVFFFLPKKKRNPNNLVLKHFKYKVPLFLWYVCITKLLSLSYNGRRKHILNYSRIRVVLKYYYCDASIKVLSTLSRDMATSIFSEFYRLDTKAFSRLKHIIKIVLKTLSFLTSHVEKIQNLPLSHKKKLKKKIKDLSLRVPPPAF